MFLLSVLFVCGCGFFVFVFFYLVLWHLCAKKNQHSYDVLHIYSYIHHINGVYRDTVMQKLIWLLIQMLTVRLCLCVLSQSNNVNRGICKTIFFLLNEYYFNQDKISRNLLVTMWVIECVLKLYQWFKFMKTWIT